MAKQQSRIVSKAKSTSTDQAATRAVVTPEPDSSSSAALAYELWQARGCPEGSPEIDWLRAKEELSGESVKTESPSTKRPLFARQVGA